MRHLLCQAPHKQHESALGRCVIGMALPGNDVMHRAHEDELAADVGHRAIDALPLKRANGFAGTEKHAGQVYVDHTLPLLQGHFIYFCVELNGSIGNANVEPAESVEHAIEHRLDFAFARLVGFESHSLSSQSLDRLYSMKSSCLIRAVVHQNVGAG